MKLVLFDLDGTLINSVPDLANSINYMLKELNRNTYSISEIAKWVGNGADLLVKRALSGGFDIENIDNDYFLKAKEIFLNHYKENISKYTTIYPNVEETLSKIDSKKVIITNKPHQFVEPILKNLKLYSYFDNYFGGDYFSEKKPSPIPLLEVAKIYNIDKSEMIMVGDSKNDILAAKNAGIPVIAVTYGYKQGEDLSKYNPDYIVNDFKDILGVIK